MYYSAGRGVSSGPVYPAYSASSAPVSYDDGYYGQFAARSGSITPVIDEEARYYYMLFSSILLHALFMGGWT